MKYIILLGDGIPDYPVNKLGGKTPLEVAKTPNMDLIASQGSVGTVYTIAKGYQPGSDVANMAILGYDPRKYYSGRAPLEAASMSIDLDKNDVAFRCNLVTLDMTSTSVTMKDFSAGHIVTEEAKELISAIDNNTGSKINRFYPGISYRHLMVWKDGASELKLTPPHDITGKDIKNYLPTGDNAEVLIQLMSDSQIILSNHIINKNKKKKGVIEANSVWFWGHGNPPQMVTLKERFGLNGSLIAAVDLMKGLGIYAGLDSIDVPGATGYLDTNYKGKAEYALRELESKDFVYLHVEAPDEAGHNGSIEMKTKAIEDFDKEVVGRVVKGIKKFKDYRILLVSDHRTPVDLKTHTSDPVPFAIYPKVGNYKGNNIFSEKIVDASELVIEKGHELINLFINGKI